MSEENLPINYTFNLELKPLRKLRLALEALVDPAFNKDGVGIVRVNEQGFKFLVRNASNDVACLQLYPSGKNMISFRSYHPLNGSSVPFGVISRRLPARLDGDADSVCISHVQGSTQLCFRVGTTPPTEFSVDFTATPPPGGISLAIYYCRTIFPTIDLRQMIDYALQTDNPTTEIVQVYLRKNFARFSVRVRRMWDYNYNNQTEMDGTRGLVQKQIQRAEFKLTYATFLYKASFLHNECFFYYLSVPERHVMFRFRMVELGELIITQAAALMEPDARQRTQDEMNFNTFTL